MATVMIVPAISPGLNTEPAAGDLHPSGVRNRKARHYSYSMENLMLTFGASVTYTYDAEGRRVRKTVSDTVTDYFYSGSEVIAEKQGSSWTDYIFFGGQRIAIQTGSTLSTTTFLHGDHLGSVRVTTNSSGNTVGTCDYEPFGESQSDCSALGTTYRFTGKQLDTETSLYHFWFRQYDAAQGRWMAVDPLAGDPSDPQSRNRYAYALNYPTGLVDPLGLCGGADTWNPETNTVGGDIPCGFSPLDSLIYSRIMGANASDRSTDHVVSAPPGPKISKDPRILNAKVRMCLAEAAKAVGKDLIGSDIAEYAVGKLDEVVMANGGPVVSTDAPNATALATQGTPSTSPSIFDIAPIATSVSILDWGAGYVQGSSGAQEIVRQALREEGTKVSRKAIAKGASRFGKFFTAFGAFVTIYSAWDTYRQCMSQ